MNQTDQLIIEMIIKGYRKSKTEIEDMRKSINNMSNGIRTNNKEVSRAMNDMSTNSKKASQEFKSNMLGAGLSFLFTFMAVKRVFDTIKQESFNTFNKLTANTSMANNAVNRLGMAMDFLKFTVADAINLALEPMMPQLLSIIERVAEWIENNEELAGKLVVFGGVASTVGMIIGQFALFIIGIVSAAKLVLGVDLVGWFKTLGPKINAAVESATGLVGVLDKLKAVGMIAIGAYLIYDGMTKLWDDGAFTNDLWNEIKIALGAAFGLSGIAKLAGVSTVAGVQVAAVYPLAIGIAVTFHMFYKAFEVAKERRAIIDQANNVGELYAKQLAEGNVNPAVEQSYYASQAKLNIVAPAGLWDQALAAIGIKTKDFKEAQEFIQANDELKATLINTRLNDTTTVEQLKEAINVDYANIKSVSDVIAAANQSISINVADTNTIQDSIKESTIKQEEIIGKTNDNLTVLADDNFTTKVNNIGTNVTNIDQNLINLNSAITRGIHRMNNLNNSLTTSTR